MPLPFEMKKRAKTRFFRDLNIESKFKIGSNHRKLQTAVAF
jgi:hypothetical protein